MSRPAVSADGEAPAQAQDEQLAAQAVVVGSGVGLGEETTEEAEDDANVVD